MPSINRGPAQANGLVSLIYYGGMAARGCFAAAAAGIVLMVFGYWRASDLFPWHPTLMALSVLLAMHEAIAELYDKDIGQRRVRVGHRTAEYFRLDDAAAARARKRVVHAVLQLAAISLAAGGVVFAVFSKVKTGRSIAPHTPHDFLGCAVLLSMLVQAASGACRLYRADRGTFGSEPSTGWLLQKTHNVFGKLTHVAAVVNVVLG